MFKSVAFCLSGLALLALVCSCEETVRSVDGGDEYIPNSKCLEGVDRSVDTDTAIPLKLGTASSEYICPKADKDYYKFEVAEGQRLTSVKLALAERLSVVKLSYQLLRAEGKGEPVVVGTGTAESAGATFQTTHCTVPGTYYLVVTDEGNDSWDGKNKYAVTITTEAEKDTNEANDTAAAAKPANGTITGYISCAGDVDYFSVDVPAGKLLEIKLSPSAATTADFRYTIYNAENKAVGEAAIPDASRPNSGIDIIHAVPAGGKYYIAVAGGDATLADPNTSYSLSYTTKDEPDANDRGGRNDTPATATEISSGSTVTGQFASKGDLDYYVINGPSAPADIEVKLTMSAGKVALDPSFTIIYGDTHSPCTQDACCAVLKSPASCTGNIDCTGESYSCVPKGDTFCRNNACITDPSATCASEKACGGSGTCLPGGKCGGALATRALINKTGGVTVATAQLLEHPGPWYIVVSDLKNDEYEYGRTYQLTVRVQADPDGASEPDNQPWPDMCDRTGYGEEELWNLDMKHATKKARHISVGQTVTGYLSYEGDVDYYIVSGASPTLNITMSTGSGCPTGSPTTEIQRLCNETIRDAKPGLEFFYKLHYGENDPGGCASVDTSVVSPGYSGSFNAGATSCGSGSTHLLSVEDWSRDNWSWSCSYTFTLH